MLLRLRKTSVLEEDRADVEQVHGLHQRLAKFTMISERPVEVSEPFGTGAKSTTDDPEVGGERRKKPLFIKFTCRALCLFEVPPRLFVPLTLDHGYAKLSKQRHFQVRVTGLAAQGQGVLEGLHGTLDLESFAEDQSHAHQAE
ncbi:MAG: hypothetical protein AUG49_25055 [Catenulispora sp. 13_1_20CM_3_70_7]|nr:MAG: hypothetical protein AUG49_25055 [Catenulispora sp. 13_1_20CM_3_70_7]